jgi:exodeoxyribonuclease V beta subunit
MTPVEIGSAPLTGTTLIEANAGTGKTWTITALYVRLLLETERTVDRILLVTFTEAATAELRDRVRTRLAVTRAAIARGKADGDPMIATLLERVPARTRMLRQLESALRNFDEAPIHTIHGFCRRVLAEHAFESGMPFATDLAPDQSELLREIVDDFWRREVEEASPLYALFMTQAKVRKEPLGPESLRGAVERCLGKPYLELRGPDATGDVAALEDAYACAWGRARAMWPESRDAVARELVESGALNGNMYRHASVLMWLDQMDACFASATAGLGLFKGFDKFTPESLRNGTRRGHATPGHPFYDACAAVLTAHTALEAAYTARLACAKMRLAIYCNTELRARNRSRRLQSYDDLLLDLHDALYGTRGLGLAHALRERYSAALIDEFQDTDPVQYAIFERIYGDSGLPVFFVGDPKQSIYSFRGADVFTYLQARRAASAAHTLEVNWRSAGALVQAVNTVFEGATAPFLLEEIAFHPSKPARGERGRLVIPADKGAALELWFLTHDGAKPMNKGDAAERAAEATAAEIARLMNLGAADKARIVEDPDAAPHGRRLRGGDIAVLVRTHEQGRLVREALARCAVSSVQRGSESVFETAEAEELERVLLAIAEPGREPLVSGALTTEMMGCSGEDLYALHADEPAWEALVETFREAHREWHEHGFVRMLRAFLRRHRVLPRLLEYADGERRVTNLLHLSEHLHCEAQARGVSGLLAWLAAKRQTPGSANEEELLRLESDENLVKILTVHVAKGLEFPLVFCPFVWDGSLRSAKEAPVAFHESDTLHRSVIDFGSDGFSHACEQAQREERAENLRLFYVALTRAKYRCWMVWGWISQAETSAPAWLLHPHGRPLESAAMRKDLERLTQRAKGTIRVTQIEQPRAMKFKPSSGRNTRLVVREFNGRIRDTRRVTSFTGLAHGRAIETPDYDAPDRPLETDTPISGRDIFAFPRGAHAGKCLHAIFQHLDFTTGRRAEIERGVARGLEAHGFDTQWKRPVTDMVQAVLATPLDEGGTLRLENITRSHRLDELEFYYPVRELSDRGVRDVLLAWGFAAEVRQRIGTLAFATTQGYMRGFIDIVFEHGGRYYLADYKSNWLGATVDAYGQHELVDAMAREAYYLQYLVYCVALHRYLQTRVSGYRYETHFGGVRYLFVRGMRPEHGMRYGVYSDRPAEGLIGALDEYLRTGMQKPAGATRGVQAAFDFG